MALRRSVLVAWRARACVSSSCRCAAGAARGPDTKIASRMTQARAGFHRLRPAMQQSGGAGSADGPPDDIPRQQAHMLYQLEALENTKWRDALRMLDDARAARLPLTPPMYAAALATLAASRQWSRGLELARTMLAEAHAPTEGGRADALECARGHARGLAPRELAPFLAELREMGLAPDAETYGAAAATAASRNAWAEAHALLQEMTRRGLVVDGRSAEDLLDGLVFAAATAERAEEARELWLEQTPEADAKLHTMLLELCSVLKEGGGED
ncbi:hypothetical protein JKP88DRAFT_346415 [Tribonema minus]|uniref:Pentacotripeptide-repeat region of PRORP domain-containing protein n=1 Tax=Tribonema minus TaxID=303371 RepID=A0A835ZL99_9STRA|nr:hypothetical protein JKP88DRAFT_346415 [Tribonema minus]